MQASLSEMSISNKATFKSKADICAALSSSGCLFLQPQSFVVTTK